MLNTFRSSVHGFLAKLLLGLLFVSFAIWGVDDLVRNPARNRTLASVGSTNISTEHYLRALHAETENIRRLMGDNYSPDALKSMNIPATVLQNLVNRRLLELESQSLGFIPSDVDVVRRVRSNPNFQDNKGNFDKAIFESVLRNMNISEKNYIEQLRVEMGINILLDTLLSVSSVSDNEAPTLLHAREEGRDITLYRLGTEAVAAIPAPSDEELTAFYKANMPSFTAPELRSFKYITISAADVAASASGKESELRAIYDERINEFKRPERRTVEQLLYSSQAQAEKALEIARKAKTMVEVAGQTDALNKKDVQMGTVERDKILDEAAETVFTLSVGDISKPVQSAFGWHIFKVTAIEEEKTETFEEVRDKLEQETKQRRSDEALTKLAEQIEDGFAGGSSLDEVAAEFKLKVKETDLVTQDGSTEAGSKSKSIPDLEKFLEIGFKTEEKSESAMITSKGGVFYALRVEKLIPQHVREFQEVRGKLLTQWQQKKRLEQLDTLAAQLSKEFEGAGGKSPLIIKYRLSTVGKQVVRRASHIVGGISLPPALVNEVFRRPLGEGTRAHAVEGGAYVVAVAERDVPLGSIDKDTRLSSSLAEISRQLQSISQTEIVEQYTRFLRNKYEVSIDEGAYLAAIK